MASKDWPSWWLWELELVPHLLKRMADRDFDEIALRAMLQNATGFSPNVVPGRFTVKTRYSGRSWEIIVEPDEEDELLVVITAYPVS